MTRFSSFATKGVCALAHACIVYSIMSPLIHWAIQPLESPNPNSPAHSLGVPHGIPPHMQIALPGDFRVGSGAGISVNNRTTITQGRWTEGNGWFLAEIVSPAKEDTIIHGAGISAMNRTAITKGLPTDGNGRFLAEIASPAIIPVSIQTIDLDDTVRSSPFTRTERQTRTYNVRGIVLTAKDSVFPGGIQTLVVLFLPRTFHTYTHRHSEHRFSMDSHQGRHRYLLDSVGALFTRASEALTCTL